MQHVASRRITLHASEGLATNQTEPIVTIVGAWTVGRGTATISRQGQELLSRQGQEPPMRFHLGLENFHQSLMFDMKVQDEEGVRRCSSRIYTQGSKLCGTGLFTTRQLECDAVPANNVDDKLRGLANLVPSTDRGFGIELEYVARPGPRSTRTNDAINSLRACYQSKVSSDPSGACLASWMCNPDEYCSRSTEMCQKRTLDVSDCESVEGTCPVPYSAWNWISDHSVKPLTPSEGKALGAARHESIGWAFELVSPPPPHVLQGAKGMNSTVEAITVLRHMGIQAGPSSGLHVHINVGNPDVGGSMISVRGIASIWAAWAKYQHVIDEMLSPSRVDNVYAKGFHLGPCADPTLGSSPSCALTRHIFSQMHGYVQRNYTTAGGSLKERLAQFCNAVLKVPGDGDRPCDNHHLHQRYYQLNIASVARIQTVEVRAHSATYDQERLLRWIQFVTAFVEHFGARESDPSVSAVWSATAWEVGYEKLAAAQRKATRSELFGVLKGLVDSGSEAYYAAREWESSDRSCAFRELMPPISKACDWKRHELPDRTWEFQEQYRCCCEDSYFSAGDGTCKWYDGKLLNRGHCPRIWDIWGDGVKCATVTRGLGRIQTKGRPGRCQGDPLTEPSSRRDILRCSALKELPRGSGHP